MLYEFAHFLRDKCPFVWDSVNVVNSILFSIKYKKNLKAANSIMEKYEDKYQIIPLSKCDVNDVVSFFDNQPTTAFEFFHPHGFNIASIKKLQKNKSFIAYFFIDKINNKFAGYCFLRSFFNGKAFRGRMVDFNYRGRGLGTYMNIFINEIGFSCGLKIFETVSKNNIASYKSSLSASNVRIVKEKDNDELYLEILYE